MIRAACASLLLVLLAAPRAHAQGIDFIADAKALMVAGACAEGTTDKVDAKVYEAHCKRIRIVVDDYKKRWHTPAREFFAAKVPAGLPTKVVYPFAGGDLATALAIYPEADEITTISLEPAGDPRTLGTLKPAAVKAALGVVTKELSSFYRANYSVTMNMIGAMRGAKLPTQLIFGLSALMVNGYEPDSLRYFEVKADGSLRYFEQADVDAAASAKTPGARNAVFANIELVFHKRGTNRKQVYRHILANLNNAHLAKTPNVLAHLEAKGTVAGMTKAASYLLTFSEFSTMRKYIIDHVAWMVSDTTGLEPKHGTPAGFEYETYGSFTTSNMPAGKSASPAYAKLFKSQPSRKLPFRFGYPDGTFKNGHLIIMSKAKK
ncbi:MAG: hypothetical protein ACKV2T_24110 [Kofleriaceae bacterium]